MAMATMPIPILAIFRSLARCWRSRRLALPLPVFIVAPLAGFRIGRPSGSLSVLAYPRRQEDGFVPQDRKPAFALGGRGPREPPGAAPKNSYVAPKKSHLSPKTTYDDRD